MSETAEKKKKIYKLATELNVSHETLVEFLKKKGYAVKNHMSSVDEDMMRDITIHFKKEKDVAEKHQRKIAEIRENKKKVEKKIEAPEHATAPPPVVHTELVAPAPLIALEEPPVQQPAQVVEEIVVGPSAVETPEPVVEPVSEELPAPEKEEVAEEKAKEPEYVSPLEKERRTKVGLTVKGKMELAPPKKAVRQKVAAAKPKAVEETQPVPVQPESEEEHRRKKKKKKVRGGPDVAEPVAEVDAIDRKKKKKKKLRTKEIDQAEVKDAIRRTFAAMDETVVGTRAAFKKRKRKEREEEELRMQEEAERDAGKIRVTEFVSVNDLANLMHVNVADVIKKCIELGMMVSINQRLDKDTITLVADEFGFEISFFEEITEEEVFEDKEDDPAM
ncbi:hypothetical protein FBQ87_09395, partial [Sphingobacteriales bacterium CHB3]|nr:hypothetical protein [Sphingobacteriales bacterium CHB3]